MDRINRKLKEWIEYLYRIITDMAFFYSDLPFDLIDGADPEGFFKK